MKIKKISKLQRLYRMFFLDTLHNYGVTALGKLTKEEKIFFFTTIKTEWPEVKKNFLTKLEIENTYTLAKSSEESHSNSPIYPTVAKEVEKIYQKQDSSPNKERESTQDCTILHETISRDFVESNDTGKSRIQSQKQIIINSEPNKDQTQTTKILYTPNSYFRQDTDYKYPVVKMPVKNAYLKLPRQGRCNQKGYTESQFYLELKKHLSNIEVTNSVHMIIPNYDKPYEPDVVLFDPKLNLYLDIEIDEPYDGFYRFPTHNIKQDQIIKTDDIRDTFFTESGWIVIRFTEKQVYLQALDCIAYIENILKSIYKQAFFSQTTCNIEEQWDDNQCIQWEKEHYREKYLGINSFHKQKCTDKILIDITENESIEDVIERTKNFNFQKLDNAIAFDEESHKYVQINDQTGNAEYISVTTLIDRFFPFDLNRYIEKKAKQEGTSEELILDKFLTIRDEASDKGTELHKSIENFLNGVEYDSNSIEFEMFEDFYTNEVLKRNLVFFEAEKIIVSEEYHIAGTIDCLFKKKDKDEFVMLDWKRSKNLVIDGQPKKYGHGYALSVLKHLDKSSYYKYCLQQNIYKRIAETIYDMKISSMQLVVLHESYLKYHVIKVPIMDKETTLLLNSLNHKI